MQEIITHHIHYSPTISSTSVVDFLILRALALLRLLLRGLQVQWLCIVMGEGLGVERIHEALQICLETGQTMRKRRKD